jgi:ubiquinone biosynthesis UbiH/UbiF/VisC/COQ6 family hydroxylase
MFRSTNKLFQQKQYDICIIGAGLVGSTLARTLECSPFTKHLRIALIDRVEHFSKFETKSYVFNREQPGIRCSALNMTSVSLLDKVNVWNWDMGGLKSATAYSSMKVWDRNNSMIRFDSSDNLIIRGSFKNNSLGYMVDNDDLLDTLLNKMENVDRLSIKEVTKLENLQDSNQVTVHFKKQGQHDAGKISAKLVVGCDGQDSIVRKSGTFSGVSYRYPLRSFVCSVECDRSVPIALQKFSDEGVLAILPMFSTGTKNVYNIVFTTDADRALEMSKLSEQELIARLNAIWNVGELVILKLNSQMKGSFPLVRSHVDCYYSWNGKLFVLGDAAHTMLPIAGQGLNMGMYDITEFVAALQNSLETGHEITTFHSNQLSKWWWRNESIVRGVEHVRDVYGVGQIVNSNNQPPVLSNLLDSMRGLGLKMLNGRNFLSDKLRQELVNIGLGNYARTEHLGVNGITSSSNYDSM